MNIENKFLKDLNSIELNFFQDNSNHNLNTCNKCGIIQNTWLGLKWDIDHDLKGHTALCDDCYEKLKCEPYED
jgi:hypothetical protein|tara:strand:- start:433 stop:651 length:219 start_codon:yes stop_codon:yes gene_type:complete